MRNPVRITDNGMNIVRGLACIAVVIDHTVNVFVVRLYGGDSILSVFCQIIGFYAVCVFFIISGYLITSSILSNIKRNGGQFNGIEYISSRIARIYPPLVFSIFYCFILYWIIIYFSLPGGDSPQSVKYGLPGDQYIYTDRYTVTYRDAVNALLMRNGFQVNSSLWSLKVEWLIYLIAGAVSMILFFHSWLRKAIWVFCLIVCIARIKATHEFYAFYLIIWFIGSLTFIYLNQIKRPLMRIRYLKLVIAGIILLCVTTNPSLFTNNMRLNHVDNCLFQILCCLCLTILLFPIRNVELTTLRKGLMSLGQISYTLYILHFPTLLAILSLTQNMIGNSVSMSIGGAILSIISSVAISFLCSHYLEKKEFFQPFIEKVLYWVIRECYGLLYELSPKTFTQKP